jgi:hypothetical protein
VERFRRNGRGKVSVVDTACMVALVEAATPLLA